MEFAFAVGALVESLWRGTLLLTAVAAHVPLAPGAPPVGGRVR